VEDIHNEPDVVKFGEQTGLGVKKGKQVKAAVEHYLQEEARLKADLDAKKAAEEPSRRSRNRDARGPGGRIRPFEHQRRCVGCERCDPRRELLRLVAENGETAPGLEGRAAGAGSARRRVCAGSAQTARDPAGAQRKAAAPTLDRLLGWMDLGSLDADGGSRLKS